MPEWKGAYMIYFTFLSGIETTAALLRKCFQLGVQNVVTFDHNLKEIPLRKGSYSHHVYTASLGISNKKFETRWVAMADIDIIQMIAKLEYCRVSHYLNLFITVLHELRKGAAAQYPTPLEFRDKDAGRKVLVVPPFTNDAVKGAKEIIEYFCGRELYSLVDKVAREANHAEWMGNNNRKKR